MKTVMDNENDDEKQSDKVEENEEKRMKRVKIREKMQNMKKHIAYSGCIQFDSYDFFLCIGNGFK